MSLNSFPIKVDQLDIDILHWYVCNYGLVDSRGNVMSKGMVVNHIVRDFVDTVAGPDLLSSSIDKEGILVTEFLERCKFNKRIEKIMGEKNDE